MMALLMMSR